MMYLELATAFSQVEDDVWKFDAEQVIELPALSKQAITGVINEVSSPVASISIFVKACWPIKRQFASLFFVKHESS